MEFLIQKIPNQKRIYGRVGRYHACWGFASGRNGQEGLVLQQLTDLGHKIYAFSVLYLIGLLILMTFVSPVILKHKEAKIEAEKPLRRKTTRAQRRREAEKRRMQ
ncbi:hypothetical protein CV093_05290 [Oceanobacillus sp. 143]|nr:hypothetical protein CV093_05290 [Oceanobacillus sp. 143]